MDIIHPGGYDLDTKWIISGYISRYLMDTWIQSGYRGLTKYPWILSIKYPSCIQSISTHIQILSMDTHLRIQNIQWIFFWISMDNIWIWMDIYPWIRGCVSTTLFWIFYGYVMDIYPWIRGCVSNTLFWIYYGYFMDIYPWIRGCVSITLLWIQCEFYRDISAYRGWS